jgi:Tol biopolymer transport system component
VFLSILCISCSSNIKDNITTSSSSEHIVFDSNRTGNYEIFVSKCDGSELVQITNDLKYDCWWPKISPNRENVLFYRATAGEHENYSNASLWKYNFKTKMLFELRSANEDNWIMQGHAEWSPDGEKIAMFGGIGPYLEIFVTDQNGKNPIQYTNRKGYNTDVSWSADGKKLIFNGYPENNYSRENYEIYVMDAIPNAIPVRITSDSYADYDPYFSPDGKKIAWLRNYNPTKGYIEGIGCLGDWAICISNQDGTDFEYLIQDGNINSKPSWSIDGTSIYFHRMEYDPLIEYRFGIFSINVKNRVLKRITEVNTGFNEYPMNWEKEN